MTDAAPRAARPGSDHLLRGLVVLESVAVLDQPANLRSIAEHAGLSESAAYRALRALQSEGYIDHLGRSGYRLGGRAVALSSLVGPRAELVRCAHPVIRRLVAQTGESAALHLRSGRYRVVVLGMHGPAAPLRDVVHLGERSPLLAGCSGQVILAYLQPSERAEILADPGAGDQLSEDDLTAIRARGYATSRRESTTDIRAIAVPLLDPDSGVPLGSLGIAGPRARMSTAVERRYAPMLTTTARELSPQLAAILGPNATARLHALDRTIGVWDASAARVTSEGSV